MARPVAPSRRKVSGNRGKMVAPSEEVLSAAAQVFANKQRANPKTDRREIAKAWQYEAYRHLNICGEARYSATLFAAMAGRAEIGIVQGQGLASKAVWINEGVEVEALAELAPTVRERTQLIRDFMLHYIVAGECYLIARDRVETDPDPTGPRDIWEIVAVTELRKIGDGQWQVKHDNGNFLDLSASDPIIRLWNPDPADRREAWSPFRSMLPTLREIEFFTRHIFTQVRTRLMSAGVWFLPDNLTYPDPPPGALADGTDLASLNEAERFMMSLAASAMDMLDGDDVSFPTVVLADPAALAQVDQKKLIQFWSEIDDKAMVLRSDAVRRFALGMDLPPEQVLGASGLAVTGAGGSAGSVNHWGVWANEEQTISAHIEPALDIFTGTLTAAYLRTVVEGTTLAIGYDTATLRLRQDRSKESIELYDRGLLKGEIALKENGFDPVLHKMDDKEFRRWLLVRITGGSATPEQVQAAMMLLGAELPVEKVTAEQVETPSLEPAPGKTDRTAPRNLDGHPYEGPPRGDKDHNPAPFTTLHASAEGLVLRALEKAGNRLLNDRTRGKDKDLTTPLHLAHLTASIPADIRFDFGTLPYVMGDLSTTQQVKIEAALTRYCARMYRTGTAYSRDDLISALEGL